MVRHKQIRVNRDHIEKRTEYQQRAEANSQVQHQLQLSILCGDLILICDNDRTWKHKIKFKYIYI